MRLLLIASLISDRTSGLGGHYSSVRDLSAAFADAWPDADVEVLTIGNVRPLVLADDNLRSRHITTNDRSLLSTVRAVLRFSGEYRPTHVHAFDNKSFVFARLIAWQLDAKIYITRPGGPNPTRYFPSAPDIICFSAENHRYLRRLRKHVSSEVHLIPQRIIEPKWDDDRISDLKRRAGGLPILLRVARLTRFNETSIRQTIELSRTLSRHDVEHSLVIVGSPNDTALVADLAAQLREQDVLLTEREFTVGAEHLTRAARGVVGSGRTLIEAAMAGAVLYAPLSGRKAPTLVTRLNWRILAEKNFSSRSKLDEDAISSPDEAVSAFTAGANDVASEIASEMAISTPIVNRYREIYESDQKRHAHPLDFVLNCFSLIVSYVRTVRLPGWLRLRD